MSDGSIEIEIEDAESDEVQEYADELLAAFRFSNLRLCREDRAVELTSVSFPIKNFEAEIRLESSGKRPFQRQKPKRQTASNSPFTSLERINAKMNHYSA